MSTMSDARQITTASYPGPLALPGPQTGEAAGAQIGPGDLWRVIKQRKVLIAVVFTLLYMAVIGGTVVTYRYFPLWSSEAFIKLEPASADPLRQQEPVLPKDYVLAQLATEAARLKDPSFLQNVLALPEVKATSYYTSFGDEFEKCLSDLRERLGATPVRDTYLIRVGLALPKKSEATLLVNSIVTQFLTTSRSSEADVGRRHLEELRTTEATARTNLQNTRDRISTARQTRDIPAMTNERNASIETISALSNTLAELQTREADVNSQLQTIQGVDPRNLPLSAEMKVIIEADPVLRYYRQQVEAMDIQIEVMRRNRIGENHRDMKQIQTQRDAYFEKETARRAELTDDLRARQYESLNQELVRIRNMKLDVSEQKDELETRQKELDSAIQEIMNMEQDAERYSRELERIGAALNDAIHELNLRSREGTLSLAMRARDAVRPSRPSLRIWLGGGFVLALMAACGLAFLREFTDKAIRTPLDVTRYGHLSVLGAVPLLDDEEVDLDHVEDATRKAPQSMIAEAFRQVRAHLTFSGPRDSQRTLLITSPRPEDGKTSVAINLAVTFAQTNERTLLIDCNFRRPSMRRAFPNVKAEGLSNVLVGRMKLDEAVNPTEQPNLHVLTSGPLPPNPAELLGSQAMRDLLTFAKTRYDRIILDGPPCLLISDALVLATQVDAVLLVARAVHGTKGTLRRAREQVQRVGARVIGAVLNGVQARPGGYFRQQYREFYEYTDEEVVMRELPGGEVVSEQDPK